MNLSLNKLLQWLIIALLFPLVFLNGWLGLQVIEYFQPLVTVFILATLLAFILNYPVRVLQHQGLKRNYAVISVFLLAIAIAVTLGITLVPILLKELHEIARVLPQWIDSGYQQLQAIHAWAEARGFPISLSQTATRLKAALPDELEDLSSTIVTLALGTIDSISEAILTIVLTFYLLLDGERLWQGIFQKLPDSYGLKLQQTLQQNFQNFFIGQIALASLVGLSMTLMFIGMKVPFGWLFGLGVGTVSLIPFGDVLSLGLIVLLLASQNFWLGIKVLAAAVAIDQVIDQAIAPRLLGSFTGLRPVWVIISLLVGAKIGGLIGLLVAVPIASSIKSAADGWQIPTTPGYATDAMRLAATMSNNDRQAQELPEQAKP